MTAPSSACTPKTATTTATYLPTARIEGVTGVISQGSLMGTVTAGSSLRLKEYHQTIPPTTASSSATLMTDHMMLAPVGRLPTSVSAGQLLV